VGRTVTATLAVVAEGDGGGGTHEGGEGRGTSVKGGSGAEAGVLWPRGSWPVSRAAAEEAGCGGQAQQRATSAKSTDPLSDADCVASPRDGARP